MRYEDASLSGSFQDVSRGPDARDDSDALAAGEHGPAAGNAISGVGTTSGSAGADLGAGLRITAIEGAGGRDSTISNGELRVNGEHGILIVKADGSYSYTARAGTPENVRDVFTYTLADSSGETDSARLVIEIGKTPAEVADNAQRVVVGPDGVVVLPAGVELSDIRVVGRDLVVMLPDGSQMVIVDGAVFVPQLVINDVEVPATNLAAILINAEPQPAAGPPQSSGGNFGVPVAPLDPGMPLGDLIPPTELTYIPPDFRDPGYAVDVDHEVIVGLNADVLMDDDALAGGNPGGVGDDPDSVNVTGYLSGAGEDGPLTFVLLTSGAPAGFTYVAGPNGSIQVMQGSTLVLAVTVDAATGAYTVVQNAPIMHPAGADENNVAFTFTYSVTDDDGDSATGTLTVNIDDDTPTIDVTAAADSGVVLVTDDADTIGGASDTATSTARFGGLFGLSFSPGADGAATTPVLSYALSTTGGASGLTSHGAAINLYLIGGVVIGSTAASAAEVSAENSIFAVSVAPDGTVTLTQYAQIDHVGTDPSPTGAPYADHVMSLVDGAITLTATASYTDRDGDPASDSASIAIGGNIAFTDDGPSVTDVLAIGAVVLDETTAATPAGFPISATSSGAIVGGAALFGADGPATSGALSYGMSVNGGGGTTPLATAIGDYPISLVQTSASEIVGQYSDATGTHTAFTVVMNADGSVTVTQYVPLEHLVDGPAGPAHNDPLTLAGLINGTVTATDYDGDTASGTIDLGGQITFRDDGPRVFIDNGPEGPLVLLTQDGETIGSATDTASIDFSAIIRAGGSAGADGGTVNPLSYALGTAGGASGLTQGGVAINLFLVGGVVVGSTAASAAEITAANTVFDVSVSATGTVTVNQYSQVDHPAAQDPTPGGAPFADQVASLVDDLITLSATISATDNDGDTASRTVTLGIGSNIQFADDGPSSTAVASAVGLSLDETTAGSPAGFPISATSASAMIDTAALYGADGPAPGSSQSFSIAILGGGATSLATAIGNYPISLVQVNPTTIEGHYNDGSDQLAFSVVMNADGTVTLTEYVPLEHLVDGPSGPAHNDPLSLSGLIEATVTVTDHDGDVATASVEIGSAIEIRDDGPRVFIDNGPEGPLVLATQDADTTGAATDIASADFSAIIRAGGSAGADGGVVEPLTYALGTVGGASGLTQGGTAINLYLVGGVVVGSTATSASGITAANTVFDVTVAPTGVVTLRQFSAVDHPAAQDPTPDGAPFVDQIASLVDELITLSATISATDNDGDTASRTVTLGIGSNIQFTDDGPSASVIATNVGVTLDETAGRAGFPISATSASAVVSGSALFGADGPAPGSSQAYGISVIGSGTTSLATAVGEHAITLVQLSANEIAGQYSDATGTHTAFTVVMNGDGTLTVTEFVPLEHLVDGPTGPAHNDPLTLAGLIEATISVTDHDGDTATATVEIGSAITILDDGPRVFIDQDADTGLLLATRDSNTQGAASDSASVDFSAIFHGGGTAGADGGVVNPLTYSLGTVGGASGLTQGGTPINLYLVGGTVVGSTALSPAQVTSANTVFDVTLSSAGVVTLNQHGQIDHPAAADPSPGGAPYSDQIVSLADNLITLSATMSATDNDGDTSDRTATIGIGANIRFADDGPTARNDTANLPFQVDDLGVETVVAQWTNTVMSSGTPARFDRDGDGATDEIRWGTPAGGSGRSGYGFVDNATLTSSPVLTNETFALGTFTHYNHPISGSELQSTSLVVNFVAVINGIRVPVGPIQINFVHDETTNTSDPLASRDVIRITSNTPTVMIEGVEYQLQVRGLVDEQGNIVNLVRTLEGQSNNYQLAVRFVATNEVELDGDVLANDSSGADGGLTVIGAVGLNGMADNSADSNGSYQVTGQHGTLSINRDGSYTYTLDSDASAVPPGTQERFTYEVRDADGDTASATLTINLGSSVQPLAPLGAGVAEMRSLSATGHAAFAGVLAAAGMASAPLAAGTHPLPVNRAGDEVVLSSEVEPLSSKPIPIAEAIHQDSLGSILEGVAARVVSGQEARASSLAPDRGDYSIDALASQAEKGPAVAEPIASSEVPQLHAPPPAAEIAYPSAAALEALAARSDGASTGDVDGSSPRLEAVVAEALSGGEPGTDIDSLLAALPSSTGGTGSEISDSQLPASPSSGDVPGWDSGHMVAWPGASAFSLESAALHHDAVQAA